MEIIERGVFNLADDINYPTIKEIYNICGGRRKDGRDVINLQKAYLRLNNKYHLWIPTLTIKLSDGTLKSSTEYHNLLSEDKMLITEHSSQKPFNESKDCNKTGLCNGCAACTEPSTYRVVFLRARDMFGKPSIKFIGVFKLHRYINSSTREFIRVATQVNIEDLKR